MRRVLAFILASAAVLFAVVAVVAAGATAQERGKPHGSITIESWLHSTPGDTGLTGTVTACFKLKGALADRGGGPKWTDATYTDTSSAATKCSSAGPVGGYVFVPPAAETNLSALYAVHTISGQKGEIFITFSGAYDLVTTYQGSGTWVITGGTGDYAGLQGSGTWTADATKFPDIRHTETGTVSWLGSGA